MDDTLIIRNHKSYDVMAVVDYTLEIPQMQMLPLMFITLFCAITLFGCSSAPETKAPLVIQAKQPTKGQIISKCLDGSSIEHCDKRYNP